MSSTYAHYQGIPGSIPQDYAILSRSFGQRELQPPAPTHDIEDEGDEFDPSSSTPIRRRSSRHGSTNARKENFLATERTPLLSAPPIPIIEEDVDEGDERNQARTRTMFWEELRILTKYAAPVFGTHLLEYSLVMASVVTIGHISTEALAAITLGSMTASVSGFSIIQGFASALDTVLPSAWTSDKPQLVGLWAQRMSHRHYLGKRGANSAAPAPGPEVARLAALYLRWELLCLPAYVFNNVSRRYFQSQGLFDVPTRIIFIVAPLNAVLNYLLVLGPDWIRLGFIGAPIATAVSINLVTVLSVIYGVFFAPRTAWHPISRRSFKGLGVLVSLGLAGVGQTASEWWAWELVALAASLLGPVALATQSILLVSSSTTFQAPFALSVATAVRIGNLLGEGQARRAGVAAKTAVLMALIIGSVFSAMFLIFRNSWGLLFNSDPEVLKMVSAILPLVALFQVFDGTSAVTGGIFRAKGQQYTGALLNLTAYYVMGIPIGVWLAFSFDMALHGLWIGLTLSLVYCAALGTWFAWRTDWEKEVRKVKERVREEAGKVGAVSGGDPEAGDEREPLLNGDTA
ncbi:mate-domain-containing protein [Schizophyllum amplum]|uniref:Mate-domain-containing protein n=1 Tax=Schizophyllum amplum TaxID=97359 RepID=A0A550CBS6_9AGAR|nr:mate-domain-containing protein [Auriculariopsis ampla]